MMSRRRLLAWVGVYVAGGLAILGFLVFIFGILFEFFSGRSQPITEELSISMQLALAGLCLAALMMIFGFLLVGVLLARQTRQQAPGYGEAYRLIEQMQFNQAIPLLEKAVLNGRETPEVLMLLSTAYASTGQLAKAQSTADRAVQLFPQDASAYITLANGYRLQASYEEAAVALRRAIEIAPEQPIVWAEQGFLYLLAHKYQEAFESFQKAAQAPMPTMYGVRVFYHLANSYKTKADTEQAVLATAKMMSARDGLEAWKPIQKSLEGTAYGSFLRYELENIEQAIAQADSANLG
jgi:tetratricopeptide (TPR) repeat protein